MLSTREGLPDLTFQGPTDTAYALFLEWRDAPVVHCQAPSKQVFESCHPAQPTTGKVRLGSDNSASASVEILPHGFHSQFRSKLSFQAESRWRGEPKGLQSDLYDPLAAQVPRVLNRGPNAQAHDTTSGSLTLPARSRS